MSYMRMKIVVKKGDGLSPIKFNLATELLVSITYSRSI